jgi:hypothetical protein
MSIDAEKGMEYIDKNVIPMLRDYFSSFIPANATVDDFENVDYNGLIQIAILKELRDIRRALEGRR